MNVSAFSLMSHPAETVEDFLEDCWIKEKRRLPDSQGLGKEELEAISHKTLLTL